MMTSLNGNISTWLAFVRGIHRSLVNYPHKGQWRAALVFSFIYAWTNAKVRNQDAGDSWRHRSPNDVTVVWWRRGHLTRGFLLSLVVFDCPWVQQTVRTHSREWPSWHLSIGTESVQQGSVLTDHESVPTISWTPVSPFSWFVVTKPSRMLSVPAEGREDFMWEFVGTACCTYGQCNTANGRVNIPGAFTTRNFSYRTIGPCSNISEIMSWKWDSVVIVNRFLSSAEPFPYRLSPRAMGWEEAKNYCWKHNMTLVVIPDEEKQLQLVKYLLLEESARAGWVMPFSHRIMFDEYKFSEGIDTKQVFMMRL